MRYLAMRYLAMRYLAMRRGVTRCGIRTTHQSICACGFATQASIQAQCRLGADGRLYAINHDARVRRADTQTAPDALATQRVGPREIEMHDHAGILQVHAFRQQVGGDEQTNALMRRRWGTAVRIRRECLQRFLSRNTTAGNPRARSGQYPYARDVGQRSADASHGLRVLRECDHRRLGVCTDDVAQGVRARGVGGGVAAHAGRDIAHGLEMALEDIQQRLTVGRLRGEQFRKCQLYLMLAHQPTA